MSYAVSHTTAIKSKSDLINTLFKAQIKDITKFSDDVRVRVKSKDYGRVTIRLDANQLGNLKENDFVTINCKEKKFGMLNNCSVYKK